MNYQTNASRFGYRKLAVSMMLGGVVAFALAGCHVDEVKSSSGGGTATAAAPANNSSSGSITPAPTPTQTQTTAANTARASCSPFPGGSGMIYKPFSEGDGNLVVLIPSSAAESAGAAMADSSGRVVEQGRFVGRTNGNRPTYRFGRPGSGFSSPAILIVGGANYCIDNTAQRYD